MSLLQFIVIVASVLFFLLSMDLYKRKKATIIHIVVFVGGGVTLIFFVMMPDVLDAFGHLFGLTRGADLLVYSAVIVLAYFYFELFNRTIKMNRETTEVSRHIAIQETRGNIENKKIIFIIPAYNENETALQVVQDVLDAGHGVVYVDDGSTRIDMTPLLRKQFAGRSLVVIQHPINLGQGAALQTGAAYVLKKVESDRAYIVHFDSDGQHRLDDLPIFLQKFEKHPSLDIVIGSRFLGQKTHMGSWWRKFHKKGQILFMRLFVGLKLSDTHNGYRVIARKALPKIHITLNRMAHASEIEQIIKDEKLNYAEVPITVLYSEYSLKKGQKLSNATNIAKEILYKKFFFR